MGNKRFDVSNTDTKTGKAYKAGDSAAKQAAIAKGQKATAKPVVAVKKASVKAPANAMSRGTSNAIRESITALGRRERDAGT